MICPHCLMKDGIKNQLIEIDAFVVNAGLMTSQSAIEFTGMCFLCTGKFAWNMPYFVLRQDRGDE